MKTIAKAVLAGVGLIGSMGAASAAPYGLAAGNGILPGGCYGNGNCPTGRCPTPGRFDGYGSPGRVGDHDYGYGWSDRWNRHDGGLTSRPFTPRFDNSRLDRFDNSRFDRFETRRDDGFGRFDRSPMFESRPGHLNVSNPGHSVRNW